jgi:hypothetical protein
MVKREVWMCLAWSFVAAVESPLSGSPAQTCTIEAPEWAPRGSASSARPRISVTLTSTCAAEMDASSVRMTVDDEVVKPMVEAAGPNVTAVYTPASALLEEADHTVVVQVRDTKGTSGEKRWTFHIGDTYSR